MKHIKQCIVYGCSNKTSEGEFVGNLCFPCHSFLSNAPKTALQYGRFSQAYRNAIDMAVRILTTAENSK